MHSISMVEVSPPGSFPAWIHVLAGLGSGRNCFDRESVSCLQRVGMIQENEVRTLEKTSFMAANVPNLLAYGLSLYRGLTKNGDSRIDGTHHWTDWYLSWRLFMEWERLSMLQKRSKRGISLFTLAICSKEEPPSSRSSFNFVNDSSWTTRLLC